jgi:hypothetical protein
VPYEIICASFAPPNEPAAFARSKLLFPINVVFQITCFVGCAVAQGVALARWFKWSAEEKARGWRLYGWFTALCCLGSLAGAISFAARVAALAQRFPRQRVEQIANKTDYEFQQVSEYRAVELRLAVLHFVFLPFELGFVTVSQLLILYRMQQFSMSRLLQRPIWTLLARGFLAAVFSGIVVGVCGNAAAVKYLSDAVDLSVKSVAAFAAGDIDTAKALQRQAKSVESYGAGLLSIQRFCEVCILLLLISVFITVGVASYRIIAAALRTLFRAEIRINLEGGAKQGRDLLSQAGSQGRRLQFKIVATVVFVFLTILVRSVFSVIYALALSLNEISNKCSPSECDPCKNVYSHILSWILYTPAFQQVTMLIASPVSQLVALWGMSGVRAFEQTAAQQSTLQAARNNNGNM